MRHALLLVIVASSLEACFVQERCFQAEDCPVGLSCDFALGLCITVAPECVIDRDCGESGFTCEQGSCVAVIVKEPLTCPEDQVDVNGAFCMDIHEASRPDATAKETGKDSSLATSRPGVLPWFSSDPVKGMNQGIAEAACVAAGKRLCTAAEWKLGCQGVDSLVYVYGNSYDPVLCNGIDTYCNCDGQDPYPHCYDTCGADFEVMPTGSFQLCESGFGAFDLSGNVWEVVSSQDNVDHYRGGAFNCRDSEQNQRCDYDATWNPSAKGFRCCSNGTRP